MTERIDLEHLRTLLAVRLAVADRSIFRDLWQRRNAHLRERRREELLSFLTQGWESYEISGRSLPFRHAHSVPPTTAESDFEL